MLRNQNKILNNDSSQMQRKFVSPTQQKSGNTVDNQKNAKI